MALFSRVKTWVSNEVLTAADLNTEFNNLLNNIDPEGIEDASASVADMQASTDPGGVGSESQATDLLGELKRLRYKIKEMLGGAQWYSAPAFTLSSGGVGTAGLADNAVTTIKITDLNVTTGKIADLGVTTGKLAANAVTRAKMESVGQQISGSSGSFSTVSTSYVDVTNLSVTITTTGRPVIINLSSDANVNGADMSNGGGNLKLAIDRSGTVIGYYLQTGISFANLLHVDPVSAGTYTYKIQLLASAGTSYLRYVKLIAYEL